LTNGKTIPRTVQISKRREAEELEKILRSKAREKQIDGGGAVRPKQELK
jgi:hypothetical protein